MRIDPRSAGRIALMGVAVALLAACNATTTVPSTAVRSPAASPPTTSDIVAKFQTEPLVVHVEQVATAKTVALGATSETAVTSSMDFDGDDVSISLTATAGDQRLQQALIVVGGRAFIRDGATNWRATEVSLVEGSIANLLASIRLVDDPAALRYVEPDDIDGQAVHRFTATRAIDYEPADGGTGQYDTFDLWVLDDGTPILVKTEFSVSTDSGTTGSGTTDFRFTKFGGPIDIVAPIE